MRRYPSVFCCVFFLAAIILAGSGPGFAADKTAKPAAIPKMMMPWNLRTKDNLDVAPGLYVFHVDAGGLGSSIGKFAIIK